MVGIRTASTSLLVRSLIAFPIAPWLIYAAASMTSHGGSRRGGIAGLVGLIFGYCFGRGLTERAGFVGGILYPMLGLTTLLVVAGSTMCALLVFDVGATPREAERFWFAAVLFAIASVGAALAGLWRESE